MNTPDLDFAIIGVQKSATSYLQKCLSEHPDVFMPEGETPTFLEEHYEPGLASLKQALSRKTKRQICGIKRPDLLTENGCAERIYKHFPACKLIVILRNPIERAYSAYFHLMSIGYIPVRKPEGGFRELLQGGYQKNHPKSETILSYGMYYASLKHYLKFYDSSNILIILHDDLKSDVHNLLKKAYSFVGVDTAFIPGHNIGTKPRASIYSLTRQRLQQMKNRQIYSFSSNGLSYAMKKDVTGLNWKLYGFLKKLDNKVLEPVVPNRKLLLSKGVIEGVQAYYRDDVDKLEDLIGRDLSSWKIFPHKYCETKT